MLGKSRDSRGYGSGGPGKRRVGLHRPLFVGLKHFALWDADIARHNQSWLRSFDPEHFEYLADVHARRLKSRRAQHAAVALRASYGLALETLFALIGARVQAPRCVFAWLDLYKHKDVCDVLDHINGRRDVPTLFRGPLTWATFSTYVHRGLSLKDEKRAAEIKEGFARLWQSVSAEFLDGGLYKEYNAAKHGLRLNAGGFSFSIGRQDGPGIPAPPERMMRVAASEFGGRFLFTEAIGQHRRDRKVALQLRNWDIAAIASRLRLISMSMNNVVTALRTFNGEDPRTLRFVWPRDHGDFEAARSRPITLQHVTHRSGILEADIEPTTEEEVRKMYAAASKQGSESSRKKEE